MMASRRLSEISVYTQAYGRREEHTENYTFINSLMKPSQLCPSRSRTAFILTLAPILIYMFNIICIKKKKVSAGRDSVLTEPPLFLSWAL